MIAVASSPGHHFRWRSALAALAAAVALLVGVAAALPGPHDTLIGSMPLRSRFVPRRTR